MAYIPVHAARDRRQEQTLVDRLLEAGADEDRKAIELPELKGIERRHLDGLLRAGVIREVPKGGRYWVDREAWDARQLIQYKVLALFVVFMLIVIVVVLLYGK